MYQYNYKPTNLSITNYGKMILWQVDVAAVPPVIYNDTNYIIGGVYLISPSIHTFNGGKADAELLIYHMNTNYTKQLMVCIPIKASTKSTSESSTFFDLIMGEVGQMAPAQGQQTYFNNATFTLNKFVPMAPYFSYTGSNVISTIFQEKCYGQSGVTNPTDIDYIVFHVDDAISMTTQALSILKRVTPSAASINLPSIAESQNPGGIHYNPNGPISENGPNEIYIDCRPTGDDGELLVTARQDTAITLDTTTINKVLNAGFLKIIVGALLMIILWKITLKFVRGLAVNTARMSGGMSSVRRGLTK